ncbi:MAG: TonB-dependent receptor [Blastocatellales bacterium]
MSSRIIKIIANIRGIGFAAVMLAVIGPLVPGQSDLSSITGTVKDQTGSVVPNAKVTVKSEIRVFERVTTTNSEGYYVISNLPPGLYTVTIEASGFKSFNKTGNKLDPNIASKVDVALEPGQLTEVVNITATVSGVQTETATVGKLVEGKQIEALQLNGRNPLFLALLKPGVAGGSLASFSFGLTSGGFSINGSRSQENLITFDGAVGVRTRQNGTSIGVADLDTTQEVQILTANYNAEYGRSSGGQIRIVTKSGGRDFHGAVFEYLRNSALNANTWDRNRNSNRRDCDQFPADAHCRPNPFRYNQFGYNLNGPVIIPGTGFNKDRNKVFWLWGQEWIRFRNDANLGLRVPTARMRAGDFSELAASNPLRVGPFFIRDPLKTGACNANDQTACFSDGGILNKIPANRLSPNGLALLNAMPQPNLPTPDSSGRNFFASAGAFQNQRKNTLSIDIYPTEKHQIRYRLQMLQFDDFQPFFGSTDRVPRIFDRPNQTTSVNWVWTVSPTWVSETLVAASRDQVFINVDTSSGRFDRTQYGINYPYVFGTGKEIPNKIPTVVYGNGFSGLDGGPYPAQSTGPIYQISNNWTNIRGNHTIKFGGYFERAGQNDFDQINVAGTPGGTNNQNGRFEFRDSTVGGTGVALGNVALGLFDSYAEIGQRAYTPYRFHSYEWFIQDSWRATDKLRLELGLRHSILQPYYSLWRNMVVFDPAVYDPNIAVTQDPKTGFIISGNLQSRYNGLLIPGDGWTDAARGRINIADTGEFDFLFRGYKKQYSDINYGNFQPRIGIAYAFDDKTVIRAGAGRFFTRLGVSDSIFLGGNPPLQPTVSIANGSVDNPGGTSGRAFPLFIQTLDKTFPFPESWAWNFTFEREIGWGTTVTAGYVGRRGLHLQRERNLNQLPEGTLTNPANAGINPDFLRPYKGFSIIRISGNEASSMYHGLQLEANRRFTNGFSFGAAYTYSKSNDDGSGPRDIIPNAYDASNVWGPSSFDRRHVMVLNAVWELPFFRDKSAWTGKVLGGWTLSAVSQMQTGTPFTVGVRGGADVAGVGPGSGGQWSVITGDPKLDRSERAFTSGPGQSNFWFRTTNPDGSPIFSNPAAGTFNRQRVKNFLNNPGFQSHNIGLMKDFLIGERHRITFRAEAFNWPNHPNWNGADTNVQSANFGKVTSKGQGGERQLQFALRYQF